MRRSLKLVFAVMAAAAGACGAGVSEPQTVVGGLVYTARVSDILGANSQDEFTLIVSVRNATGSPQMITYPTLCPVRIQLYRDSDSALLYDETRVPCDMTMTTTNTIDLEAIVLTRTRFTNDIAGDSIPNALYRVKAAVFTNGSAPVIVDAGLRDVHSS